MPSYYQKLFVLIAFDLALDLRKPSDLSLSLGSLKSSHPGISVRGFLPTEGNLVSSSECLCFWYHMYLPHRFAVNQSDKWMDPFENYLDCIGKSNSSFSVP